MGTIYQSVILVAAASFVSTVPSSLKEVKSIPYSKQLTNMQFYKDKLYIGGTNKIYALDMDLNEVLSASTCNDNAPYCNNVNKVLVIDNSSDTLVICGTGLNGECGLFNASNLIKDTVQTNVKVSTDINRPAQAMITEDKYFMIAVTFGDGIDPENTNGYYTYKFAISTRKMPALNLVTEQLDKRALNLEIEPKLEKYVISYKSCFQNGSFSYFVTVQKEYVGADKNVSKLVRICQDDKNYGAYTDIMIQCTDGKGTVYGLIQNAIITNIEKNSQEQTFFGTFTQGNEGSANDSVICSIGLNKLDSTIKKAKIKFATSCEFSDKSRRYLPDYKNDLCLNASASEFQEKDLVCELQLDRYKYVIGDITESMTSGYRLPADKGIPTSLYGTFQNEDKFVLMVGMSKGELMMMNYDNGTLNSFSMTVVSSGEPVRAIYPANDDDIYVMSKQKVFKFASSNCSEFTTCEAIMKGKNPLCGWCVYDNRTSRKSNCSDETDHWLSSLKECIQLELEPKGTPANSETKQITIRVRNIPANRSDGTYKCFFINGSKKIDETPAGRIDNGNTFTCEAPKVSSHTLSVLELVFAFSTQNVTLAKADFLFYDCQTYRKCGECVETVGANCTWDLNNGKCTDHSAEHISNEMDCPRLVNNRGVNFIPTSVSSQVTFKAVNIPNNTVTNMWCYVPKNGGDILEFQQAKVDRTKDDSFSCNLNITSLKPSKGQELRVFIKYGSSATFSQDLAEFDEDDHTTVTVYSCAELGKDCSHCRALISRYACTWCSGDGKCQYKDSCMKAENCPRPTVTKIVPKDGPWQGGSKVTISGTELGSQVFDINSIVVAGAPCELDINSTNLLIQPNEYFKEGVPSRIVCTTEKKGSDSSKNVTVIVKKQSSTGQVYFTYKKATFAEMSPKFGPVVGGTQLTIYGENLGIGNRQVKVAFGVIECLDAKVMPEINLDAPSNASFTIQCRIKIDLNSTKRESYTKAHISIDGTAVLINVPVNFTFLPNPEIEQISPKKGTVSGGTGITITGKNMNNTHVAKVEGNFQGEKLKSTCEIQSPTKTICRAPKATKAVQDMVEELIKSPRTKRSDCSTCIDITVYLDGFGANFTLTYYRDPSIHPFEEKDKVHLFSDENKKLTIRGEYINLVAQESDVNITIGLEKCSVFELKENLITCLAPKEQPASRGSTLPEVNVTIGNYNKRVGFLKYEKTVEMILYIAGAIGGGLLAIIIIGVVFGIYKYKKVGKKAKEYERNLSDMEMEIKRVAREEFLDMHTTMSSVNKNLVEQGFPYHGYQQFACNVMFSVDYLWTEPVMTDDERLKANKGMESLELLISNKFFLVSVITTMENEKRFFIREKSNLAGNLCAVLMGRMDYLNEILKLLMTNLVQESSTKKHKTLFRRCESITEKLLSNWLSLCLYPHVKSHSGSPLYLLYMATQKTMESGPIDAVTGDAKYTLSEEKLLKKWSSSVEEDDNHDLKFEAKTLTLNVVVDNGEEIFKCKALDCDTVSQVKSKCLNQIYVNYPASQLPVGADDLALEWHEGFGGALRLRDEDNTSKREGHWVRLNTLAHYNVKDESNMALIDPHSAEINNQEDYVNLANINMEGVCDGSIDSSQPLTPHDEENPHEFEHWHLVKKEEESAKQGKSAIAELYLNRLFTTKQSLMEYMRPLFDLILDHDRCPPPTKFLYDFLDELGEKYKVETDTVHAWKSHSYAIRVWASLMKMPNTLFDVAIPSFMEENLNIISQVFIESFSLASQKFTKDSPSQKLIFHHEMNHYRDRVKEFYKNVKVDSQNSEEFRQYMAEVNRLQQQTNFNKVSALYRFYNQLKPYFEDILENLSKSKEASTLQLDRKLEQVIAIMEEED